MGPELVLPFIGSRTLLIILADVIVAYNMIINQNELLMDPWKYYEIDLKNVENIYNKFETLPEHAQHTFLLALRTGCENHKEDAKDSRQVGLREAISKSMILHDLLSNKMKQKNSE